LIAVSIFAAFGLAVAVNQSVALAHGDSVKAHAQKGAEKQATNQEKENKGENATDPKGSTKGGKKKMNSTGKYEVATLAGGGFWCLEGVYNDLRGGGKGGSGYLGGRGGKPTHEERGTGKSG